MPPPPIKTTYPVKGPKIAIDKQKGHQDMKNTQRALLTRIAENVISKLSENPIFLYFSIYRVTTKTLQSYPLWVTLSIYKQNYN